MSSFRQLMMRNKGGGTQTLNATVVGNPTISDDFIVSSFTQVAVNNTGGDYLRIPSDVVVPNGDSWELHLKVMFNFRDWLSYPYRQYYLLGTEFYLDLYVRNQNYPNKLAIEMGDKHQWYSPTGNTGSTTLSNDQWYYIRIKAQNGTGFYVYLSTDDSSWTTEVSFGNTYRTFYFPKEMPLGRFILGGADNTTLVAFQDGKIDMKETYLKVNDNIAWQGVI